jgi:hypothetical protein
MLPPPDFNHGREAAAQEVSSRAALFGVKAMLFGARQYRFCETLKLTVSQSSGVS